MTERPILFSGAMVRAILAGGKTMTRRTARFEPLHGANLAFSGMSAGHYCTGLETSPWVLYARRGDGVWDQKTKPLRCPYGVPGDRLWVRETCRIWWDGASVGGTVVEYRADNATREVKGFGGMVGGALVDGGALADKVQTHSRWRTSIHMPRAASRITLEVTGVRVERLQAITEGDARAEGVVERDFAPQDKYGRGLCRNCGRQRQEHSGKAAVCNGLTGGLTFSNASAVGGFALLWDGINGKRAPWASNPWVWVVEFKRVED